MDTTDTQIVQGSETAPTPAVDPKQSVIASLREARNKIGANADPVRIAVPGYNGDLVIEYQWIPFEEISATSDSLSQIKDIADLNVAAAADTVVACCREVFVRIDGRLQPLSTNGTPVKFDDRLAYSLGIEATTARATAIAVFNNEYALIETANELAKWLKDASVRVNGEFLGE